MILPTKKKLALAAELRRTIADDRYPLSPRARTLQSILDKLDLRPAHDPAPPLKRYKPPWKVGIGHEVEILPWTAGRHSAAQRGLTFD